MMSMLRASGCMRDLDALNVPYHLELFGFSLAFARLPESDLVS
jgi:hypothetical protein